MNRAKLFSLFLVFFAILCFPLPVLFKGASTVWGIPALYFYLFVVWAGAIVALALIVKRTKTESE
ncbi:hypothetical protein HZ996_11280 [Cryomorphaceae bacterium]|nr:hypothetical protein HZ996_11280 [Cryomorphaceae bacterium]